MNRAVPFLLAIAAVSAPSASADAQAPEPDRRTVQVTGNGMVETPPGIATITFTVVGEGRTADEATAALAAKHKAIVEALAGLLGDRTRITAGSVAAAIATGPACQRYGPAQMSSGDCAVTGYLATLNGEVRTSTVAKAGTAAGLAARLGARSAAIAGFALPDEAEARRRATVAAIADARARAAALAQGLGQRLGPVMRISDQEGRAPSGDIVVTGAAPAPPPPPPPPPPIPIDITPRLIETRAQVYVTFALEP